MKKFFENFNIFGMIMLMMCVLLGVGDVSGAVMTADAAALTPEGAGKSIQSEVNNVQTTNNVGEGNPNNTGGVTPQEVREAVPGLIKNPVDQNLVKIRPYANPIDTLLRYAGADQITGPEFDWYSIGTRQVWTTVTGDGNYNTTASEKTGAKGKAKVAKIDLLERTDTACYVNEDTGASFQIYVYKKDDDFIYYTVPEDKLTGSTGSWKVPDLAVGGKLYIMGRAGAAKDVTSPELSVLPQKQTGYCQIFMMQIEENTYTRMAEKEIDFNLSEVEENVMFEYRRRMEGTWLRGHQCKIYDPEKKTYIYQTGGLLDQITKSFDLYAGSDRGNDEIVDLSKYVFSGNNGSKVRYAICGSEAMARLSKLRGVERRQDAVQTEVVYGITWSKMVTNFGQINMVLHEQLDEYGLSDKMIIVDPEFLKMKRVETFTKDVKNGKDLLITNGTIVIFKETVGLAVYNPDVHCVVTVHAEAPETPAES